MANFIPRASNGLRIPPTHHMPNQTDPFNIPTALLESFIPGFGLLSSLFEAVTGIDATRIVSYAFIVAVLVGAGSYVGKLVRHYFYVWCTSCITIMSEDKLFEQVMFWLSQHQLAKNSRSLKAKTSVRSSDLSGAQSSNTGTSYNFARLESSIPPEFIPAHGSHTIWFRGWPLLLYLDNVKQNSVMSLDWSGNKEAPQYIQLRCLGRSTAPIKAFLMACKEHDAHSQMSKTIIRRTYPHSSGSWYRALDRPSRSLDTVYMNDLTKEEILADVKEFIHPKTQSFYGRRGIPYRRGYLFHGPPGTGKTSMSFALAGQFGFDFYVLSLREPNMNEHKLAQLFSRLPAHCIVLLEDIDTAGLEKRKALQTEDSEQGQSAQQARSGHNIRPAEMLSLSGLLNAIDGVASHEGRILVMTTNDPEQLDKALIRPGRVDKQVYFGPATKANAYQIFHRMYTSDGEGQRGEMDNAKHIEDLARQFEALIPDSIFTPAEIQGFLLTHKGNPQQALDETASWRDVLIQARSSGSNILGTTSRPDEDVPEAKAE